MKKKPELLSPCGSMQALKSAVAAGCDAVYLGSGCFSARAYAENFTDQELEDALQYCSLHEVKTYLTVNTLVKDQEWPVLTAQLEHLKELPLTGVIVQDLGVASYIRDHLPQWELHASTQMSVTDADGVKFLEREGFRRVVLARELTLDEIRQIRASTTMELEVFVHGALCYCVSGQCLLSSMIGGRSGNRGRCAQSCRLPYRFEDDPPQYLMNLKDLCTLPLIQELSRIGIDSFKIEGRMKSPEYVYGVTQSYRKALDGLYDPDDEVMMAQLFNRGGFTRGYLVSSDNMIEKISPKHQGLKIGSVSALRKDRIYFHSDEVLHPKDVVEIRTRRPPYPSYQLQERNLSDQGHTAWVSTEQRVAKGMFVYRLQDAELLEQLKAVDEPKIPILGKAVLSVGNPVSMTVQKDAVSVTAFGAEAVRSEGPGMSRDQIEKQLKRTGGTPFNFQRLEISAEEGLFIPVSALNAVRREALDRLRQCLSERCFSKGTAWIPLRDLSHRYHPTRFEAVVSTQEQASVLSGQDLTLFVRDSCFEKSEIECVFEQARQRQQPFGLSLSELIFPDMTKRIEDDLIDLKHQFGLFPLLVHSYGQIELAKRLGFPAEADGEIPVMNSRSAGFLQQKGIQETWSPELSVHEMPFAISALKVYGKIPVMTTRQCMQKEAGKCLHKIKGTPKLCTMTDRKGVRWVLELHCRACYTQLYTSQPLYTADLWKKLPDIQTYRLFFLNESSEETAEIIRRYRAAASGGTVFRMKEVSRGHMLNPVE